MRLGYFWFSKNLFLWLDTIFMKDLLNKVFVHIKKGYQKNIWITPEAANLSVPQITSPIAARKLKGPSNENTIWRRHRGNQDSSASKLFKCSLLIPLGNRQNWIKNSMEECIFWQYNISYWMLTQQKLTPPELTFSVFGGWVWSHDVTKTRNFRGLSSQGGHDPGF